MLIRNVESAYLIIFQDEETQFNSCKWQRTRQVLYTINGVEYAWGKILEKLAGCSFISSIPLASAIYLTFTSLVITQINRCMYKVNGTEVQ